MTADFFAALDRFQQKGVSCLRGDGQKRRHRSQQIGGDGLRHWDQGGILGETRKFFVVGTDHAGARRNFPGEVTL